MRDLEVTDSTQDDARAAFSGDPVVVVAGAQRRGRGRLASEWYTAPRAMAASLAFRLGWDAGALPLVPLLAGVAAARTVPCRLKWPNDVLMNGRKAGGILVEAADAVVVAGFGLNLWWPDPPEGVGAVYTGDPGPDARVRLAERWAGALLRLVAAGPSAWPRDEYRRLCDTIGRHISWVPDGTGRAVDIASDGGLVVDTGSDTLTLHAGEVRHVR